jgi:hypothetical protein
MEIARDSARMPSKLSQPLLHHLDLYALAASAAGVSLLALTPPAEAKIVYTKTHQVIGCNGIYELDLNHDGIVDFLIQQVGLWRARSCSTYAGSNQLLAKEALGNAVQGSISKRYQHYAWPLKAGADIGPRQHFIGGGFNGEIMVGVYQYCDYSCGTQTWGKWVNVHDRYLGLKFKIQGKPHYGWARLSVQNKLLDITGTLTGYAYETVANRPIRAGQTKGSEAIEPSNPNAAIPHTAASRDAALGELALGALGVPAGRQP